MMCFQSNTVKIRNTNGSETITATTHWSSYSHLYCNFNDEEWIYTAYIGASSSGDPPEVWRVEISEFVLGSCLKLLYQFWVRALSVSRSYNFSLHFTHLFYFLFQTLLCSFSLMLCYFGRLHLSLLLSSGVCWPPLCQLGYPSVYQSEFGKLTWSFIFCPLGRKQ